MLVLQYLKQQVHPHHTDIESLNQQAADLTKDSTSEQAAMIRQPMSGVNTRWHELLGAVSARETQLQNALLNLGQFQGALDELLAWLDRTDNTLGEMMPVYGDPKVIEIELAKLRVCCFLCQAKRTCTLKKVFAETALFKPH